MKGIVLLFGFVLVSGCAASTHYLQTGAKTYPATQPEKIRLFAGEPPGAKYEVIGSIAVDKPGTAEEAQELLKEKAAKLGANAVIQVRPTKLNSFSSRSGLSGTAALLSD